MTDNVPADPVDIRLFGDFAIIHARITYRTPDGKLHEGRYTDDWALRGMFDRREAPQYSPDVRYKPSKEFAPFTY